jgi:hypothetical protein
VAGTLRWRLTAAPLTRCVLASSPTILWLLRSLQSSTRPCAGQNGERASGVMLVAGVPPSRQPWQGGFRRLVISVSIQARVRAKQIRANICQSSFEFCSQSWYSQCRLQVAALRIRQLRLLFVVLSEQLQRELSHDSQYLAEVITPRACSRIPSSSLGSSMPACVLVGNPLGNRVAAC